MPHDRLRFAWIPPPRGAGCRGAQCTRNDNLNQRGRHTNAGPTAILLDIGRVKYASEQKVR